MLLDDYKPRGHHSRVILASHTSLYGCCAVYIGWERWGEQEGYTNVEERGGLKKMEGKKKRHVADAHHVQIYQMQFGPNLAATCP